MTTPQQRPAPATTGGRSAPAPRPYGRYTTVPRTTETQPPRLMTSFWVVVDGVTLPSFTECQGLSSEYEVSEWKELGQNQHVHKLPGRISFSPITLTRYVDGSSGLLAAWFSSVADPAQPYRTGRISAVDAAGKPVAHWNLSDVFASKYTGPSFTADGTTAATESVELVHHGFVLAYAPASGSGQAPAPSRRSAS